MTDQPRRVGRLWHRCIALTLGFGVATLLAAPPASGTSPDPAPSIAHEEIDVHWRDNGRAYQVPPGSKIFIALPASPQGGGTWRWKRRATDPYVATPLQRPAFLARPESALDEIEGFQVFSFVAEGAGRAVIKLRFRDRGGVGDPADADQVIDRFRITLDVR